jgi:hypothetical protein
MRAFFDSQALMAWWQSVRSVTSPRVLGPYVVEWRSTDFRDEMLGRLGGILRGTVMEIDANEFFVAELYWLPPDGDPIGPMALHVRCTPAPWPYAAPPPPGESATEVRIAQSGFDQSARWRRFYEVFGPGWERALATLKSLLER